MSAQNNVNNLLYDHAITGYGIVAANLTIIARKTIFFASCTVTAPKESVNVSS